MPTLATTLAPRRPLATAALAFLAVAGCADATAPATGRVVYGPAQPFAQGAVRAYAVLDSAGAPTAIGVALSDGVMQGLPAASATPEMPMDLMRNLALPAAAVAAGYDHASFGWNPTGHDPVTIYGAPHFDFHFYTVSETAQMAMLPSDPAFLDKLAKVPDPQYRPATYVQFPGGVPMMGSHWGDPASPELVPNAPAGTFTRTFLYGSYDGHFVFYEPMITRAYLEGTRARPAGDGAESIKTPTRYERPGAYPTRYTAAYDATAHEYRVAIAGLVRRD